MDIGSIQAKVAELAHAIYSQGCMIAQDQAELDVLKCDLQERDWDLCKEILGSSSCIDYERERLTYGVHWSETARKDRKYQNIKKKIAAATLQMEVRKAWLEKLRVEAWAAALPLDCTAVKIPGR